MTTAYALMLSRCGLSHREAAHLHSVRLDTVKSWANGRNPVPPFAIGHLRALYARLELVASEALTLMDQAGTDVTELGLASDDHEARDLGWPCVGAHAAMLGLVAVRATVPVEIVPCWSMEATEAAAIV